MRNRPTMHDFERLIHHLVVDSEGHIYFHQGVNPDWSVATRRLYEYMHETPMTHARRMCYHERCINPSHHEVWKGSSKKPVTPEKIKHILELRAKGLSSVQIGRRVDLSRQTILNIINREKAQHGKD